MVVEIICTIAGVSPLGWSDGPGPKAPRGVVVLDEPAVIGQPWRVARPPAPGAGRPRHHVGGTSDRENGVAPIWQRVATLTGAGRR
jgi:hypothetical protein